MAAGISETVMNSRGTIIDLAVITVMLFVIALVFLILHYFTGQLASGMNATGLVNVTPIVQAQSAFGTMNVNFIFLAIGGIAAAVTLAFLVPTHPVFAVISVFVLLLIVTTLGPILSNMFNIFAGTSPISSSANQFGLVAQFFSNLPLIIAAAGIAIIIVMFAKKGDQGGGYR